MEISEIKSNLTIADILKYYGLKADKNAKLICPFHDDNTPSLQIYYKTQTAYCFAGSCKTHGKSMDVIDFVMHKEGFDRLSPGTAKHEALKKCKEIIGQPEVKKANRYQPDLTREAFLANMYQYFKNAMHSSGPAKDYLQLRSLDFKKIEIGYNAGQFHHGARKDENLIKTCIEYGLLIDKDILGRTGEKAYGVFGKWCICFAMRNIENQIVSLYFRSTLNDEKGKHFYLKNRQGLYPNYPKKDTKKLILTESIIDGATLLQVDEIAQNYSILACYGTNGLTAEHMEAIKNLSQLEEIIFCFDNDKAGNEASEKYANMLKNEYKNLKISTVELPNKDANETLIAHEPAVFKGLFDQRKDFFSSTEKPQQELKKEKISAEKKNIPIKLEINAPVENVTFEGCGTATDFLNVNNYYTT